MNRDVHQGSAADASIVRLDRVDLSYAPQPWPFAETRRAEIDRHFAQMRHDKPALWNGRVLLLHRYRIDGNRLEGAFLETDFASFMAWRDWGFPDAAVTNCFAQGALRGTDGAYLLGLMGPHTAAAGKVYFPSGTPEPHDVVGDTVDIAANLRREVEEETGLTAADLEGEPGWTGVVNGPRLGLIKVLQARAPADALRERIRTYIAQQHESELADMVIVRGPADLDARMPSFVIAFLEHVWNSKRMRGTP
jgi:8-oxo-dGTP pyrophosphatase MutT (NUDIX family)